MSLLFLESFDDFSTSIVANSDLENALRQKYSRAEITVFEDGGIIAARHGTVGLFFGHEDQLLHTRPLKSLVGNDTAIIGWAMKMRTNEALQFNDIFLRVLAGGAVQFSLRQQITGLWTGHVGTSGTILESSPGPIVQPNSGWYYVEVKIRIHASLGNWEVKIDGTTVWTSGNYDTESVAGVNWDSIEFDLGEVANNTLMDDMYICDGSGSVNNDFLGDTVVENIIPQADGDNSQWTPSTGTNHAALVDEATNMTDPGLSEVDFVESSTPGDKDLFTYTNLSTLSAASAIHGVQVNTWRRITAEQPADLIIKTKTGTTEGDVTETIRHDDSTPYFIGTTIFELDPDTAAAWTPGGVDGAQFGVEVA